MVFALSLSPSVDKQYLNHRLRYKNQTQQIAFIFGNYLVSIHHNEETSMCFDTNNGYGGNYNATTLCGTSNNYNT